jgi:hypothetical protein
VALSGVAGAAVRRPDAGIWLSGGAPRANLPRQRAYAPAAARTSACPEIDCVRGILSGRITDAAERRAQSLAVGVERVLIRADAITEEAYLAALAHSLGTTYESFDTISRADCPLDDDKIALVAVAIGGVSSVSDKMDLSGLPMEGAFFFAIDRVLYTAAFLFLVAKLTNKTDLQRLAALFPVLYVLEFILECIGDTTYDLFTVVFFGAWTLIEWLFVAATFLRLRDCLKDWMMLAIAFAIGACEGIIYSATVTGALVFPLGLLFLYVAPAICLTYGIRRTQATAARKLSAGAVAS